MRGTLLFVTLLGLAWIFNGCYATKGDVEILQAQLTQLKANDSLLQQHLATADSTQTDILFALRETRAMSLTQSNLVNQQLMAIGNKIDDSGTLVRDLQHRVDVNRVPATTVNPADLQVDTMALRNLVTQPRAYMEAARTLQAMGKYDSAAGYYQMAADTFPGTIVAYDALYQLGECHFALNRFKEAVTAFNKLLTTLPKGDRTAATYFRLAQCKIELKDKTGAKNYLKKLDKEYPKTPEAEKAKELMKKVR